jgi:hypothetical protein
VGKQPFSKSLQISNSQDLGLIPLTQIRKFLLGVPVRKSKTRQIFMTIPQIANPQISTKCCTGLSQKSRLLK